MKKHVYGVEPLSIVDFCEQILGQEVQPFQRILLIALQEGQNVYVPCRKGKRMLLEQLIAYVEWTRKVNVIEMSNENSAK
jgi:hypothetical protein